MICRTLLAGLSSTLLVGLSLLPAGCWSASPPPDSASWSLQSQQLRVEGRMQIRRVLRALEVAESTGNLEAMASLYTPDANGLAPGGTPLAGREEILANYVEMTAEQEVSLVLVDQSVSVAGDAGEAQGWAGLMLTSRMTGEMERKIFRFRMVLDRDVLKVWRIRYLEWWPWADLEDGPEPTLPGELGEEGFLLPAPWGEEAPEELPETSADG